MQTSVQVSRPAQEVAPFHSAALRFVASLFGMLFLAFMVGSLLAGCGGGGADQPMPGQCYVNGVAADASACRPGASVQPVDCSASGSCK